MSYEMMENYKKAEKAPISSSNVSSHTPVNQSHVGNQAMLSMMGISEPSRPNHTGIPDGLKARLERLTGMSLDDVHVHYNSKKPAELGALAYTYGTNVYIGPRQEQHLNHELGHVLQQKLGMVRPTSQTGGIAINESPWLESQANHPVTYHASTDSVCSASVPVIQCQKDKLILGSLYNTALYRQQHPTKTNRVLNVSRWNMSANDYWMKTGIGRRKNGSTLGRAEHNLANTGIVNRGMFKILDELPTQAVTWLTNPERRSIRDGFDPTLYYGTLYANSRGRYSPSKNRFLEEVLSNRTSRNEALFTSPHSDPRRLKVTSNKILTDCSLPNVRAEKRFGTYNPANKQRHGEPSVLSQEIQLLLNSGYVFRQIKSHKNPEKQYLMAFADDAAAAAYMTERDAKVQGASRPPV